MTYYTPFKRIKAILNKKGNNWDKWLMSLGNDESGQPKGLALRFMYFYLNERHQGIKYYLQDDELGRFLIDTKIPDMESVRSAIGNLLDSNPEVHHGEAESLKSTTESLTFAILTPDAVSRTVLLTNYPEANLTVIDIFHEYKEEDKLHRIAFVWDKMESFDIATANSSSEQADDLALILNLMYYIQAFPDAILEGKPEENGRISKAYSKCRVLKTHPDIIETSHETTARVTHFRKGHFRVLRSSYFKEPGKVIFVHSCIVKGTPAKTVI